MTGLALQGQRTIFGIAGVRGVATEHRHVRTSDQQDAPLGHALHRPVQEGVGGAIRVEINGMESLLWCSVLVHHHAVRGGGAVFVYMVELVWLCVVGGCMVKCLFIWVCELIYR